MNAVFKPGGQAQKIGFGREYQYHEVADAVHAACFTQGAERGADSGRTAERTNERIHVVAGGNEGSDDGVNRQGFVGGKTHV